MKKLHVNRPPVIPLLHTCEMSQKTGVPAIVHVENSILLRQHTEIQHPSSP